MLWHVGRSGLWRAKCVCDGVAYAMACRVQWLHVHVAYACGRTSSGYSFSSVGTQEKVLKQARIVMNRARCQYTCQS